MTDAPAPERSPNPAEAIFREARGAHEASRTLLPLLALLEEPEGSGALDELKTLLSTIVQILGQHSASLEQIKASVGNGLGGASPTA